MGGSPLPTRAIKHSWTRRKRVQTGAHNPKPTEMLDRVDLVFHREAACADQAQWGRLGPVSHATRRPRDDRTESQDPILHLKIGFWPLSGWERVRKILHDQHRECFRLRGALSRSRRLSTQILHDRRKDELPYYARTEYAWVRSARPLSTHWTAGPRLTYTSKFWCRDTNPDRNTWSVG